MKLSQSIYYVDPETENALVFKNTFEGLRHSVQNFSDGHELIHNLEFSTQLPDIIFLAYQMPVINGKEVLDIIKESKQWHKIPIVVLSDVFPRKMVRRYIKSGVNLLMKTPRHKNYISDFNQVIHSKFIPPEEFKVNVLSESF